MRVQVLLADKGSTNGPAGTLNLLNVGWTQTILRAIPTGVPDVGLTVPHAVAIFFEVEPKDCNHPIDLELELEDEDGKVVSVQGPAGPQEMRLKQPVTVKSPGGVPLGTPGTGNALIEIFPGLPLKPGGYRWKVRLGGRTHVDWFAAFRVMPPE
jgi:hypothetical protein